MLEQHDIGLFNTFEGQKGCDQIIKHVNSIFFMDVYSGGRVWGSAQFSRTQGVFLIY